MRLFKISILLGAVVGIASLLLAPNAFAKTQPPVLAVQVPGQAGPTPLGPGDPLKWITTDAMFTVSGGGTLQCTNGELDGTLSGNGAKKDGFSINGASLNDGAGPAGVQPCDSSLGPANISFPTPFQPWTGNGNVVNGKVKTIGPIIITADFSSVGLSCSWSATKVKGVFNHDGQPIMVHLTDQKFKRVSSNSDSCPGVKGQFSADFSLQGEPPGFTISSFFDVFTEIPVP